MLNLAIAHAKKPTAHNQPTQLRHFTSVETSQTLEVPESWEPMGQESQPWPWRTSSHVHGNTPRVCISFRSSDLLDPESECLFAYHGRPTMVQICYFFSLPSDIHIFAGPHSDHDRIRTSLTSKPTKIPGCIHKFVHNSWLLNLTCIVSSNLWHKNVSSKLALC